MKVRRFRAPGRVNLIGEHTDYNGGLVFPAAIHLDTRVTVKPLADGRLRVSSRSLPETLDSPLNSLKPNGNWTDYVAGVAAQLHTVDGAELYFESTIPLGGGLSSSAALTVATAFALGAGTRPRTEIALLCQRAENEFTGMQCGIMDPLSSCLGEDGCALRIDCRDLTVKAVPIPESVRLVIANTMVKHDLAASAYNDRRAKCESAARSLNVPFLRDVDYSGLKGDELRFARHVVTENRRVLDFESALLAGDMPAAGAQMFDSHRSLRDDFEVSCPELDAMVDIARELPGVFGARLTGGGFGGCTVNLVAAGKVAEVVRGLTGRYLTVTGIAPHIFVTRPSAGASEIDI